MCVANASRPCRERPRCSRTTTAHNGCARGAPRLREAPQPFVAAMRLVCDRFASTVCCRWRVGRVGDNNNCAWPESGAMLRPHSHGCRTCSGCSQTVVYTFSMFADCIGLSFEPPQRSSVNALSCGPARSVRERKGFANHSMEWVNGDVERRIVVALRIG